MTTQDIVNEISKYLDNGGNADYISLTEGLELIKNISGAIIDLLVAIIIIGLPIVVAIEVCYINFPVFQKGYDDLYNRLEGKRGKILGLLIRDATYAVKLSNTTEYGVGANTIYFKVKIKTIFICVLTIGLVLGAGPVLINWGLILIKGIMNVIHGII